MIYQYGKSFVHEDLTKKEVKKEKFKVFEQKDFDDYRKARKEDGFEVKVIFNTKLKIVKPEKMEEDKDYLAIGNLRFELLKEKAKGAKYYIPVDEDTFIRVEKQGLLIILLLGLGAIALGSLIYFTTRPASDLTYDPLKIDDQQQEGQGQDITTPNSEFYQESTVIPGYAEIEASKGHALIPLKNPEQNTVNFVYTILVFKDSAVVETVDNATDAYNFINTNAPVYTNFRNGKDYAVKNENGDISKEYIEYKANELENGKFEIVKNTYQVVYFTDGIAPGNHIDWDCYEYLGTGDFQVQFRIATFDVETSSPCYGAVQPVHILVR